VRSSPSESIRFRKPKGSRASRSALWSAQPDFHATRCDGNSIKWLRGNPRRVSGIPGCHGPLLRLLKLFHLQNLGVELNQVSHTFAIVLQVLKNSGSEWEDRGALWEILLGKRHDISGSVRPQIRVHRGYERRWTPWKGRIRRKSIDAGYKSRLACLRCVQPIFSGIRAKPNHAPPRSGLFSNIRMEWKPSASSAFAKTIPHDPPRYSMFKCRNTSPNNCNGLHRPIKAVGFRVIVNCHSGALTIAEKFRKSHVKCMPSNLKCNHWDLSLINLSTRHQHFGIKVTT